MNDDSLIVGIITFIMIFGSVAMIKKEIKNSNRIKHDVLIKNKSNNYSGLWSLFFFTYIIYWKI